MSLVLNGELHNGQEIVDGCGVGWGNAGTCGVDSLYRRNCNPVSSPSRDGIPFFESVTGGRVGPITLDPELGWRATEYYEEALVEKTKGGMPYSVRRSQKQYGFRQFVDPSSSKPKMFIIGESFTHASAVSDDRTYHALLSKLLDAEIFAHGAGGYGTLQDYLILDRYADLIKPNMIL